MKYSEYYKILHRRNKYNVKFLLDFLTIFFPLNAVDYDSANKVISISRSAVGSLSEDELNMLSRVISSHSYYDAFDKDKLLLIPLFP